MRFHRSAGARNTSRIPRLTSSSINIGNAKIQGLVAPKEKGGLNMLGNDYNIALFIFFIPYILLEVPCNILLKKLRPSVWLSSIMFGWAVITICQGVTQSFAGLVVCRVLLGVFEAGFFPGAIYLISMYYKRHELQLRVNAFFSASILAGAFSGLLAYAIASMGGIEGYGAWRWIFIIEGCCTAVIAAVSYFVIPDWPETAGFLKPEERTTLLARLAQDTAEAKMNTWDKNTTKRIFGDLKIYLGLFMYLGIVNTGYATSFFTPTILTQLGWKAIRAQVMSIPIYIAATICALTVAYLTDRFKRRFPFIMIGCCITTIGYILLLNMRTVPIGARYFALYLITCGGYIAQPVTIVWLNNNVSGHYKRGVAMAMQIGLGNSGGIIASNIFITDQAPYYPVGFGVSLGLVWVCGAAAVGMLLLLRSENAARNLGKRDDILGLPKDEQENMGDDHPSFRFTY
jgi:MFS family permease